MLEEKKGYSTTSSEKEKKRQQRRKTRYKTKEKKQASILRYYTDTDEIIDSQEEVQANQNLQQTRDWAENNSNEVASLYGSKIIKDIDDKVFRIFNNNINGITTACNGDEFLEDLTILKEFNVSAATLTETNTNWNIPGVYEDIKRKLNKVWKRNKLTTSNSYERTKTKYQPGGTATLIMNKSVQRISNSGSDCLG